MRRNEVASGGGGEVEGSGVLRCVSMELEDRLQACKCGGEDVRSFGVLEVRSSPRDVEA